MQATIQARRSAFSVFLIALALFGTLILGGAGGYFFKSLQAGSAATNGAPSVSRTPSVDLLTGYPSGSVEDQRILAFLKQSGYEGGGTIVAPAVDPLTGYPSGSDEDRRILAFLKESRYEGGGTVVQNPSAGSERP